MFSPIPFHAPLKSDSGLLLLTLLLAGMERFFPSTGGSSAAGSRPCGEPLCVFRVFPWCCPPCQVFLPCTQAVWFRAKVAPCLVCGVGKKNCFVSLSCNGSAHIFHALTTTSVGFRGGIFKWANERLDIYTKTGSLVCKFERKAHAVIWRRWPVAPLPVAVHMSMCSTRVVVS